MGGQNKKSFGLKMIIFKAFFNIFQNLVAPNQQKLGLFLLKNSIAEHLNGKKISKVVIESQNFAT